MTRRLTAVLLLIALVGAAVWLLRGRTGSPSRLPAGDERQPASSPDVVGAEDRAPSHPPAASRPVLVESAAESESSPSPRGGLVSTVFGRVVDERRRPVDGADVVLLVRAKQVARA